MSFRWCACDFFSSIIGLSKRPKLKCFKANPDALLPIKAHLQPFEDAAYDLFYPTNNDPLILLPGERKLISSGLKVIIPKGYWVKFHERSGNAAKKGLAVLAGVKLEIKGM